MFPIYTGTIMLPYLPSESEEMQNEIHCLSLFEFSSIDTESLLELLLPGFFTDNKLIQVDTSQICYSCNKGLIICRLKCVTILGSIV